jgi:hypothetical protein
VVYTSSPLLKSRPKQKDKESLAAGDYGGKPARGSQSNGTSSTCLLPSYVVARSQRPGHKPTRQLESAASYTCQANSLAF